MSNELDKLDQVLIFICTPSGVLAIVPFSSDCMPYDVAAALWIVQISLWMSGKLSFEKSANFAHDHTSVRDHAARRRRHVFSLCLPL